jgi:hypothetical protein
VPSDWLFYWMTRPTGLVLIAAAIAVPFGIWRVVLGRTFSGIGYAPLAAAYGLATVGLFANNFASSYLEFSSRVAEGVLPEAQRWSIVPGWTLYVSVLSLIAVLPLVGLVGVPLSASLLRVRRLTPASIGITVAAVWVALVLAAWTFPSNEWHRTHRAESLGMWLKELAPGVLLVALPFLSGVYVTTRRYRGAGT